MEFVEKVRIMDAARINRALARLASEIVEENQGASELYLVDLSTVGANPIVNRTELPGGVDDRNIVLIDDVLYTGRTIRAALDQLIDFGRPRRVQLAVLVDRGREH